MTKFLGIMSAKGGVGKTTTALNISTAMACFNSRVVLVDGNLSTPHIGVHLGLVKNVKNINDVFNNEENLMNVIYQHSSGLGIILGDISLKFNSNQFVKTVRGLNGLFDYVVIDSPAGMNNDTLNVIECIDKAIIVVNPDILSCTEGLRLIKLLESRNKSVLGVILNKVSEDKFEINKKDIEIMLGKRILIEIPEDKIFKRVLSESKILVHSYPNNKISEIYKMLGAYLVGKEYKGKWKSLIEYFKV